MPKTVINCSDYIHNSHGSRCPILHNTLWTTHFVSCISVLLFLFLFFDASNKADKMK